MIPRENIEKLYRDVFSEIPDIPCPKNARRLLAPMLSSLPLKEQRVLSLRYGLEEPHEMTEEKDAAEALGMSVNRMKSELSKALTSLGRGGNRQKLLHPLINKKKYEAEDLQYLPIEVLYLSENTCNRLKRSNIHTVLDLARYGHERIPMYYGNRCLAAHESEDALNKFLAKNDINKEDLIVEKEGHKEAEEMIAKDFELLDKIRQLNELLKNSRNVSFDEACRFLADSLEADAFVISAKGKVLGSAAAEDGKPELIETGTGSFIDKELNRRLLSITETDENADHAMLGIGAEFRKYRIAVVPMHASEDRMGTLLLCRKDTEYSKDDVILMEYGAMLVGLEVCRALSEELAEERHKRDMANSAVQLMNSAETAASIAVLYLMAGHEATVSIGEISEKTKITKSSIVSALRKLEDAEIIETKPEGTEGTHIKVLNDMIYEKLDEHRVKGADWNI